MHVPPAQLAPGGHDDTGAAATRSVGLATSMGERDRINLSWLVQLHWWAILGQFVVIAAAEAWSGIGLPVGALSVFMAIEVVGNTALALWARRAHVSDGVIAAVMFLDIAGITVLLDLTGGASNPFSTIYLVNVALAAVLLPRWAWTLMLASLGGFIGLHIHEAIVGPAHHVHSHMAGPSLVAAHLRGMWLAFSLAAVFIVYFVRRVSRALAERERELAKTRAQAQRREKLASLATLAAGAAHELATPLGTIAIVAKELQHALAATATDDVRRDLDLVREQVARCRMILDHMSAHAGANVGEPLTPFHVNRWVELAVDGLSGRERVDVQMTESAAEAEIVGPSRALGDALRGMLRNALQASPPEGRVTLKCTTGRGRVRAAVIDRGRGIPPDVLERVGEPFFTTKSPGQGMGLGLFLTRALAEQLDGEFQIASRPGEGTEAWIELPARAGRSTQ